VRKRLLQKAVHLKNFEACLIGIADLEERRADSTSVTMTWPEKRFCFGNWWFQ
jgi:hypothetical protein